MPTEYTDSHLPHSERSSEGEPATTSPLASHGPVIRSLGQLAKGLSALFWGLPIALVVCVQCAKGDWFRPLGVVPPLVATGLLFYALSLLGNFQQQERIWISTLERAKIIALINVGISPFLYWWSRIPSNSFFSMIMDVTLVAGLLFLLLLNPVLVRLTAMLPDETLRMETRLVVAGPAMVAGVMPKLSATDAPHLVCDRCGFVEAGKRPNVSIPSNSGQASGRCAASCSARR